MIHTLTCADCSAPFTSESSTRWSEKCPDCRVYIGNMARCRGCGELCSARAIGRICRQCQRQPCHVCGNVGKGTKYCSDACRAIGQAAPITRTCVTCGKAFPGHRMRRVCSTTCKRPPSPAPPRICLTCGDSFTRHAGARRCIECSNERKLAGFRRKNAVRRGASQSGITMSIRELGDRDGWRCHLCRKKVDPTLKSPDPGSATFDHLIPISDHGDDSPENLALAHHICNSKRGARGVVQLLLVG